MKREQEINSLPCRCIPETEYGCQCFDTEEKLPSWVIYLFLAGILIGVLICDLIMYLIMPVILLDRAFDWLAYQVIQLLGIEDHHTSAT